MSDLRTVLRDYLDVRRTLGYRLVVAERLLGQFLNYLDEKGASVITAVLAIDWASTAQGASPGWIAQRLSTVRGFAAFAATIDPRTEVPPARCLPGRPARAIPYLYTETEIDALMAAARGLRSPLLAVTYETLIGLLAVSGMRIGEALRLARDDVVLEEACVRVIGTKFGKSREVPIDKSSVDALRRFAQRRDELMPAPSEDCFFCSTAGTRLVYARVRLTFVELCRRAGVVAISARCRPRMHDLRHRFTVTTLVAWQEQGADVDALLPLLSTVLGHVNPANTCWYLTGTAELFAPVVARLEQRFEERT